MDSMDEYLGQVLLGVMKHVDELSPLCAGARLINDLQARLEMGK